MAWNELTITLVNLTEQTGGKPFSPISVWPVIIPVPPKSFFTGYLLCPLSTKAQRRKSSVHKRLLCRKCPESLMEVICSGDNMFFLSIRIFFHLTLTNHMTGGEGLRSTTSICFINTYIQAGRSLRITHLCT